MTAPVTITLPWPGSELSGHAKGNWNGKHRATKRHKRYGHAAALAAGAHLRRWPAAPVLRFTYHPPARGGLPDCQNMPARLKPAVDGIADAIKQDDRGFRCRFPDTLSERKGQGEVIVEMWVEE